MRIMTIISIFLYANCYAAELKRSDLIKFYAAHGITIPDEISFGEDSAYFCEHTSAIAYACGNRVALSQKLIASLEEALTAKRDFTVLDQKTLIHEWVHLGQPAINDALDNHPLAKIIPDQIPFARQAHLKNEAYADLLAYLFLTPKMPLKIMMLYHAYKQQHARIQTDRIAIREVLQFGEDMFSGWKFLPGFTVIGKLHQKDLHRIMKIPEPDGIHPDCEQSLAMLKVFHDIAQNILNERALHKKRRDYGTFNTNASRA